MPRFTLTFVRRPVPTPQGLSALCAGFAGIAIVPFATPSLMNSSDLCSATATACISSVTVPARAASICVIELPSLALPTSGSKGRDHLSPLSRPMSAPLSSCNGSTYPFCCSLARMTETISSHRMQASLHNARQVAPGGPKEPSHEFSTSQNAHARSRRKPEGRSPLFENASSYCWRLLATNRWLLLRGLSGSVRTSLPASARGFRYACAT